MFERYTEKARRVVFFARYEASMYGSPAIETEHLLLGLLREDYKTAKHLLPGLRTKNQIQNQIESQITRRDRIPTSVEMPLSKECKQVLTLASEESKKIGHKHVGTEHLLLGLLRIDGGIAAGILRENLFDLDKLREEISKLPAPAAGTSIPAPMVSGDGEIQAYREFIATLRQGNWSELTDFFAREASFIDANGTFWSRREEIASNLETLLAPFATKNAKHHLEKEICRTAELWIGTIMWNAIHLQAHTFPQQVRMTLVFGNDSGKWSIFLIQITALNEEQLGKSATR
jgi:hypothetical protein